MFSVAKSRPDLTAFRRAFLQELRIFRVLNFKRPAAVARAVYYQCAGSKFEPSFE